MAKKSKIEIRFDFLLNIFGKGIPRPLEEHRFHPVRRWRFDYAWPDKKVAVECDGGQWKARGGRHARDSDREKLNEAMVLGWRVLRFSGSMLEKKPTECIEQVRRALSYERR